MFVYRQICLVMLTISSLASSKYTGDFEDYINFVERELNNDDLFTSYYVKVEPKVSVKLYYEALCSGCQEFYNDMFLPAVTDLKDYVDVEPLPFGNGVISGEGDQVTITCQHGPKECYANTVQACALDLIKDVFQALDFNGCMLGKDNGNATNSVADMCGNQLNVDSGDVKDCANSDKGFQLLLHYGRETEKVPNRYEVPDVLINGTPYKWETFDLHGAICDQIVDKPNKCKKNVVMD